MKIAILPGDGIGTEIVAEAVKVMNVLDLAFETEHAPVGTLSQPSEPTIHLITTSSLPSCHPSWLRRSSHRSIRLFRGFSPF